MTNQADAQNQNTIIQLKGNYQILDRLCELFESGELEKALGIYILELEANDYVELVFASSTASVAGTANTGGGGGGGADGTTFNGSAGGSGVVIISYAGSQQFNGGLVTSSGGNTIHTFNATGALTPLTNNLTNSLRFRSSASAFLNRTPTLAGSRTTWT
jgi:hypothetical protein